jgi:predicted Zn-dependent protease
LEPIGEGSGVYTTARFLSSCSQVALKQYSEALTTLTALLKRTASPSVLNNLGVVQLRLSAGAAESGGRPTWYFNQARELDPQDPDFVFNLGYAYWMEHDAGAATYWLKEAVRLNPADGAAHAVLSQALKASGAISESARELELAQQLSSVYEALTKRPADAETMLRGLARLKDRLGPPHAQRMDTVLEASGQRERGELATIYLDRGRRLFEQERDREAASELSRALYLSPYQAEAHLLLGRVYLRTGRLRDAIDELKISLWSEETASAHLALAEAYLQAKNEAGARAEAQRTLAIDPASIPAKLLLERLGPPRGGTLPL